MHKNKKNIALNLNNDWTTIIHPKVGWFDINFKEIWQYRDLILLFVRRDFVAQFKQTIFGPLWFIVPPILTTIIFTVIFGNVAKISTDGLPKIIFYMSGIVAWRYFSNCFTKSADSLVGSAGIFSKVYFPRLTVPISMIISNLFTFGLQFLLFLCFLAYYMIKGTEVQPNIAILLTPVLIIMMALLGLGAGIIISSLTVKYRDLRFLISFGVQLLMYASPIIYPLSLIPEKYRIYMLMNPVAPIIETFRYAYLGQGTFSWNYLGLSALTILFILVIGLMIFNKVEKTFVDII